MGLRRDWDLQASLTTYLPQSSGTQWSKACANPHFFWYTWSVLAVSQEIRSILSDARRTPSRSFVARNETFSVPTEEECLKRDLPVSSLF